MKNTINEKLRRFGTSVKDILKMHVYTPQPSLSPRLTEKGAKALRICGLTAWGLFPFLCFLISEYICFVEPTAPIFGKENLAELDHLFRDRIGVVILDLLILYTTAVVISLIAKRLWVSCAVIGTVSFAFSGASFFKYQVTGEYFSPFDLKQTGNVGILTDYINTDIPASLYISAVLIIGLTVLIAVSRVSFPVRWSIRIPVAVITVVCLTMTYSSSYGAARLVSRHGMSFDIVYKSEKNYSENGFWGAMTLNLLSGTVKSPEEYSKDAIDSIMSSYNGSGASESFSRPNIVVILQESFWDIRQLPGCTFSKDPLENYDKITAKEGVYSGRFLSPTFGGGTVRPEFELLTGLSADYLPSGSVPYDYIENDFESYPLMLRTIGYDTVAIHPYQSNFYSRDTKYPHLGFDRLLFNTDLKNIEEVESTNRGGFVSDDSFVSYIEYFLEEADEPLFLFGISMEGHQPYENKFTEENLTIRVTNPAFDKDLENTVSQYAQCLADADASLGRLTEYIDSLEEDTILVVFGDHAPSLGSDKAAYKKSGFISEGDLVGDDMIRVLETPFFIYSNFETEESSMLEAGTENVISPYNLMNAALELIGAPETPLMEFLKDYYRVCPAYNVKIDIDRNSAVDRFTKAHEFISYDRIRGEGYSISK